MSSIPEEYNKLPYWEQARAEHRSSRRRSMLKSGLAALLLAGTASIADHYINRFTEESKSPQQRQDEADIRQRHDWSYDQYKRSEEAYLAGKGAMEENNHLLAKKYFLQAIRIMEERKAACPATETKAAKECRDENDTYIALGKKRLRELEQ